MKVKDMEKFNVNMEDITTYLDNSIYKNNYCVYDTFREQDATRWKRGKKLAFQQSLVDCNLDYFAYIKFYLAEEKKYALVVGKSGSKKVNTTSGCDLSFSTRAQDGNARKWLLENNKSWCQTKIIIIRTNAIEKKESEHEAYRIERCLQTKFDLFGS